MDEFMNKRRPFETGQQTPGSQFIVGVQPDNSNQQLIKGDSAAVAPAGGAITSEQLRIWTETLNKYKAGKKKLETRVINAERWWKLRNSFEESKTTEAKKEGFQSQSAWLHNVINSKHADYLEAYPAPNILPREEADKVEAWALKKIVPVILKHNDFEETYDMNGWQKLKTGCAVYKIIWDNKKLNGLGDISIKRRDLLGIYWEPGINDIQDSKMVFDVEMRDKEGLIEEYSDILTDKVLASAVTPAKFPTDDNVPQDDKVAVIDVYYKRKGVLHYCKYVGETVLYATENDNEQLYKAVDPYARDGSHNTYTRAEKGLYDHGLFPYVFDTLFPIEGSPAGYGYVDICANAQTRIDLNNRAFMKNTLSACTPRVLERVDGAINEDEFLDLEKTIIHVTGNLNEDNIRFIQAPNLSGNYISFQESIIQELRETSGNTETSTGSSTNGVTAASALAALQEAAGKTSRASTVSTYRAFKNITYMVIELIRQFYDMPRQFRITGSMGVQKYITFHNAFMQPQWQGMIGDMDLGYRSPVYDIEVEPEKKTKYTQIAQNELAIQLYGLGFFNPQLAQQAMLCLSMMDFDGKDDLQQQIQQSFMQFQQMQMLQAMAIARGQAQPAGMMNAAGSVPNSGEARDVDLSEASGENKQVEKSRERAQNAGQPGKGSV